MRDAAAGVLSKGLMTGKLAKGIGLAGGLLAVAVVMMGVYTSAIGTIPFTLHRAYALILCFVVALLGGNSLVAKYGQGGSPARIVAFVLIDVMMAAVFAYGAVSFVGVLDLIETQFYTPSAFDVGLAMASIGCLMELGRRIWGWPLTIVALSFLAYLIFGDHLPAAIGHRPMSWDGISTSLWYGYKGVFSTTLSIVLNVIIIYIFFGTLLESTGAGAVLLKLAFAVTGGSRGGPAHAAIVASSLFGTMSGSTVANVVGTGTFTIPMIKKRGFPPEFAGGIEATASSGGQIVPPIMGAAAFVMADIVGLSYLTIATAAIVPAFLYYLNLYFSVIFEARKRDIKPIPRDERPKIEWVDIYRALQFVVPIVMVVIVMVMGRSVAYAGAAAVAATVITGFIVNPDFRRNPRRLVEGAITAGRSAAGIVIAVGVIGLIIGTMDTTGAGLKFAGYISHLGADNLFLSLVLAMFGALILGMGMPTLPAYLIIALVLGPAIEIMGISPLSAHMFVFYYGVASSITPPVALAAYAAAPIAGANPLKTGIMAVRLGMAKFLVPFLFVYNPVLLLVEGFEPVTFALVLGRVVLAFWLISSALTGFERTRLSAWDIVLRAGAGLMLVQSYEIGQLAGFLLGCSLIILDRMKASRMAPAGA